MICKYSLAIFASRKASYTDLSLLFKDHPYVTLDGDLINAFDQGNAIEVSEISKSFHKCLYGYYLQCKLMQIYKIPCLFVFTRIP